MFKKIYKFFRFILYAWWVIPPGNYCYKFTGKLKKEQVKEGFPIHITKQCPYWEKIKDQPEQENGHCRYLGLGDYDKNNDPNIILEFIDVKTGKVMKKIPATEMPFGIGLLWDQVKECGIKDSESWDNWENTKYMKPKNYKKYREKIIKIIRRKRND